MFKLFYISQGNCVELHSVAPMHSKVLCALPDGYLLIVFERINIAGPLLCEFSLFCQFSCSNLFKWLCALPDEFELIVYQLINIVVRLLCEFSCLIVNVCNCSRHFALLYTDLIQLDLSYTLLSSSFPS